MTGAVVLTPLRRTIALLAPPLLFAAALLCGELAVRRTQPPLSTLQFFVTAPKQQATFVDRDQVSIFEGDPLLLWRLRPNLAGVVWDGTLVSTNDEGLRYPRPVGPKPRGALRILCVGDSVTFGYRVPRVYHRRESDLGLLPYPALLEEALRSANPGRQVEVLPLAVPGYSSHQGLAWLRRDIARLAPDLVTICFGWNDIDRRPRTDAESMPTDRVHVMSRDLVGRSQALMRLVGWLRAPPARLSESSAGVMRVPRPQYVANVLEMARLARAHGAWVVVLAPIYRDPIAHPPEGDDIAGHREALRAATTTAAVPFLEVPELTEKAAPENHYLFEEHIHPNHRGHRLLAARLLAFLGEGGPLGGWATPRLAAP